MAIKAGKSDRIFLWIVIALVSIGIISFTSASLAIYVKDSHQFFSILFSQLVLGLVGGIIAFFIAYRVPYTFWKKAAPYLFVGSIFLTAAVFIPHLGSSHGGAKRWISIHGIEFQPVEFLKISFVLYFAAWLSWMRERSRELIYGLLPLLGFLAAVAIVLFRQPDTKSFILMAISGVAMLFLSGIPVKYLFGVLAIAVVLFGALILVRPYVRARVETFLHPTYDPQGSSFQLQQSLIAIGSGEIFGRGLGQSVQKFTYLPEPQGDSIFAVIGEEFGFLGTSVIVILYCLFCLRTIRIAYRSPDSFSRLAVAGLGILMTAQAFMNMASANGLFPLTGVPLVFMSQGGTALLLSIGTVGLLLNISRYSRKTT